MGIFSKIKGIFSKKAAVKPGKGGGGKGGKG